MENAFQKIQYNKINEKSSIDFLDDSQKKAVNAQKDGARIVIQASAGSGKTSTLIAAITAYRYENINDRICAITYTRAARAEMEQRLQENGVYDVEVTTIHVWSRRLLEQLASRYDFRINLLQEKDIKEILKDLSDYYKKMKNKKYLKINIDILYSFIMGNKNMDISDSYRGLLKALESMYIEYKETNMLYDFTDYPKYLYDVINLYDENITGIDALFVDEFQDVDPIQLKLFDKIINCNQKFFIGDEKQSIFVFRGADGEVFNKLQERENFEVYKLNRNYRSYQCIIDYACNVYDVGNCNREFFISDVMDSAPSGIKCVNGEGGFVIVSNEVKGKIKKITGRRTENMAAKEFEQEFEDFYDSKPMILCRSNKQVKEITSLGYTNVTTIHQAKGLEYDNVIVADMLIDDKEELNIAYVALTRAKKKLMVLSFGDLCFYLRNLKKKKSGNNIFCSSNSLI